MIDGAQDGCASPTVDSVPAGGEGRRAGFVARRVIDPGAGPHAPTLPTPPREWRWRPPEGLGGRSMRHPGGVPYHPPTARAEPDPRLDPYRERAGVLFRQNEQVGVLYLRVGTWWQQVGGHLWWRRWSEPREQVEGYLAFTGGEFDDFVEDLPTLGDELADWRMGRFLYRGELLHVTWLDDATSQQTRIDTFGLDPNPDVDRLH
jgi:hypothetical protein